jgi:hypothetical protein
MPASFVSGRWTIPPGVHSTGFTWNWPPGQRPNKGPMVVILSPDHPPRPEEVKLSIDNFGQVRTQQGPVIYSGSISNSSTQTVGARLLGVIFPEFQSQWEM